MTFLSRLFRPRDHGWRSTFSFRDRIAFDGSTVGGPVMVRRVKGTRQWRTETPEEAWDRFEGNTL